MKLKSILLTPSIRDKVHLIDILPRTRAKNFCFQKKIRPIDRHITHIL